MSKLQTVGPVPVEAVEIRGVRYQLAFDLAAVDRAEQELGCELLFGLNRKTVERPTIRLVRGLFWAMLQRHHSDVTIADATRLVTQRNIRDIWDVVIVVYVNSIEGPEEEEGGEEEENPTPSQG